MIINKAYWWTMLKTNNCTDITIPRLIIQNILNDLIDLIKDEDIDFRTYILSEIISNVNIDALSVLIGSNWYSATQIGKLLNISRNKVGRLTNKLNIKYDPSLAKNFIIKINDFKYSNIWFYNEKVLYLLQEHINLK